MAKDDSAAPASIPPDARARSRIRLFGEIFVGISAAYAAFLREPQQAAESGYKATGEAIVALSQQVQAEHDATERLRTYLQTLEASQKEALDAIGRTSGSPVTSGSSLPACSSPPAPIVVVTPKATIKRHTWHFVEARPTKGDPVDAPSLTDEPPPVAMPAQSAVAFVILPPSSASAVPSAGAAPPPVSVPSFDKALGSQK